MSFPHPGLRTPATRAVAVETDLVHPSAPPQSLGPLHLHRPIAFLRHAIPSTAHRRRRRLQHRPTTVPRRRNSKPQSSDSNATFPNTEKNSNQHETACTMG